MDVLSSIKLVEAPQMVKTLTPEEQDVLMKYLYAGMAAPEQNNSGTLLVWHEKVRRSRRKKNANEERFGRRKRIRGKATKRETRRRITIMNKDRFFSRHKPKILARCNRRGLNEKKKHGPTIKK